ncbi:MAG: enoyl-CoA hydratase [Rhodospirillales bacterium]
MSEDLVIETRGPAAHVMFNRPAARNALTMDMYAGLAAYCRGVDAQGPVKAVVISGAGGAAFAAGTDMSQFKDFSEPRHALEYEKTMDAVLGDIESCPVPTIAALSGACTGGGAVIAAACDIRITAANLRYGVPIARTLGNCLSVANLARLSAVLGPARTREIMLTARLIEAPEALTCGLVSEVLDTPEAALERAFALAKTLAGHAPLSMRAAKEAMRRLRVQGAGADDADLITSAFISEDFQEGVDAFLNKRKPAWKGK